MTELSADIVVVGAGVLGLCTASELAARGHDVRVMDPGEPNASSVAAGMIAPAGEVLLDHLDGVVPALLREAAALWPSFAQRTGVVLDTTPAEWRGDDLDAASARLTQAGLDHGRVDGALRLRSDIQLEPAQALAALAASTGAPLLPYSLQRLAAAPSGWLLDHAGGTILARHIVLANGVAEAAAGTPNSVAALLARVRPIAGQIGRVRARLTDRVVRGEGVYVVPGAGDTTLIGATMVEDERRPSPDPAASRALIDMAESLLGKRIDQPVEWRVGVRGASPDGLPMAGPSGDPSIHMALAPRRNGWLLAPMVGRVVADEIEGRPRDAHTTAFDPLRFSPRAA